MGEGLGIQCVQARIACDRSLPKASPQSGLSALNQCKTVKIERFCNYHVQI